MPLPQAADNLLRSHSFNLYSANEYTSTPAYVRKIGDLTVKGVPHYNCAVVVENWAKNFIIVEIYGFNEYNDRPVDLTRNVLLSGRRINAVVDLSDNLNIIDFLSTHPVAWASQYGSI